MPPARWWASSARRCWCGGEAPRRTSERRTRLDGLAFACLLPCCGLWGLNQAATKLALATVPPLTQAAIRLVGAALLAALWLTPLLGLWAGVLLLSEPLTARLLAVCAAVAVGIAVANRPPS